MNTIEEILANTEQVWRIFVLAKPCREWQRAKDDLGYGRVHYNGRNHLVHRLVYQVTVEPTQADRVLDHLCQNPRCCETTHLDLTTQQQNLTRGIGFAGEQSRATHCPAGHPYNEENTYVIKLKKGAFGRRCRECNRLKQLECAKRRLSGTLIHDYAKKTHCDKGHPFDEENTYVSKTTGQRYCKACRSLYAKAWHEKRRLQTSNED